MKRKEHAFRFNEKSRVTKEKKKKKEKTTPFGVNLMRGQVLYWAAQEVKSYTRLPRTQWMTCLHTWTLLGP